MSRPRVALVTGASSGIGLATVRRLARRGDHVVLLARDEDALRRTAAECEALGAASTLVLPTDISHDDEVAAAVAAVLERHERLDDVVSNAGVVAYGRVEEMPAEVFDGVLATNLHGAANLARHVVPVLRRQQQGHLVIVGSVIGHVATPGMTAYAVSKWGLRSLARQLQLENRDLGRVRIGYVAPGGVDTPIYRQAAHYDETEGRPLAPAVSAEDVADRIMDHLADKPFVRSQVGIPNDAARVLFTALPRTFDAVIGPLADLLAHDLTSPARRRSGNVLRSQPRHHATSGDSGHGLPALARNLISYTTRRKEEEEE